MRTHAPQSGLSLVELMVAVAVGLLLLAGVVTIVVNTNRAYGELHKSGAQIENGRYALHLLREEVRHAGFFGEYGGAELPPAALPDPCATDLPSLIAGLALPLQGVDAPAAIACLPDLKAGSDLLVVRRAATVVAGPPQAAELYLQGLDRSVILAAGDGSFDLLRRDGTPMALRDYRLHIYYVATCNLCDGDAVPTLKRAELRGGTWRIVRLVEGIDDLQIDYGIDSTLPPDGAADSYTTLPATAGDWFNVVALRLHLLARNVEATAGHDDGKVYTLGLAGEAGPFHDGFKRHLYSAQVRVTNVSARRS